MFVILQNVLSYHVVTLKHGRGLLTVSGKTSSYFLDLGLFL